MFVLKKKSNALGFDLFGGNLSVVFVGDNVAVKFIEDLGKLPFVEDNPVLVHFESHISVALLDGSSSQLQNLFRAYHELEQGDLQFSH